MATTISPSLGQGPLFVQEGPGVSPGYAAIDLRRAGTLALQEGVLAAGDFMVTQRAAGANLSVDIAAGSGAMACVQGDTITGQGLYAVAPHSSATINEVVTAASVSNPRIDQVILEVLDNQHDAGGSNLARVRVLAGTATVGATLANRTGVAALPSSALLLADILVGTSATTIPNTVIRDRRKWARGAFVRTLRSAANYTTTTTGTPALLDSANVQPRIECSGVPLRATLRAIGANSLLSATTSIDVMLDGTRQGLTREWGATGSPANMEVVVTQVWELVPAAGSHLVGPGWHVSGGTATLFASGNTALEFTVEEIVRQNSANNTTTSG